MTLKEIFDEWEDFSSGMAPQEGGIQLRECATELKEFWADTRPRPEPPTEAEIARAEELGLRFSARPKTAAELGLSFTTTPKTMRWRKQLQYEDLPSQANRDLWYTDFRLETRGGDPVGWSILERKE